MDFLLEALTNWLKEMLVGGIMSNLSGMFDSVNQQVADISVQVGQTPQGWNGSIFNMIENLSNSIMVPIAGVILAIVSHIAQNAAKLPVSVRKLPDTSPLRESPAVKGTWQRMYLKPSSSRSAPEMRQCFMGSRSNEMAWPAVPFTMIRTPA